MLFVGDFWWFRCFIVWCYIPFCLIVRCSFSINKQCRLNEYEGSRVVSMFKIDLISLMPMNQWTFLMISSMISLFNLVYDGICYSRLSHVEFHHISKHETTTLESCLFCVVFTYRISPYMMHSWFWIPNFTCFNYVFHPDLFIFAFEHFTLYLYIAWPRPKILGSENTDRTHNDRKHMWWSFSIEYPQMVN